MPKSPSKVDKADALIWLSILLLLPVAWFVADRALSQDQTAQAATASAETGVSLASDEQSDRISD